MDDAAGGELEEGCAAGECVEELGELGGFVVHAGAIVVGALK